MAQDVDAGDGWNGAVHAGFAVVARPDTRFVLWGEAGSRVGAGLAVWFRVDRIEADISGGVRLRTAALLPSDDHAWAWRARGPQIRLDAATLIPDVGVTLVLGPDGQECCQALRAGTGCAGASPI